MDCNVTEPLCSIWSSDCTYRRHPNIRLREHTFQGFENKDYEFMLIVAIKLLLASIGLYLGKKILWFMYWLLFQPFNWTKVSCTDNIWPFLTVENIQSFFLFVRRKFI